jgi:CelD/BcsL family acetyltransferase involved in cellulose biosynthesis
VSLHVETIEETAVFERLREAWTELLAASSCDRLFLTWEWLFTWWKHLAGGRKLSILAVRSGRNLVGLAPLALAPAPISHLWSLPRLEFLGVGNVGSDYLDVIIRRGYETGVMGALAEHLAGRNLAIALTQIDAKEGAAWRLGGELAQRGWSDSRTVTSVCPFIDLRGRSWSSYLESRGASLRYNFRRRVRQLERSGICIERAEADGQRQKSLELLVALHHMRWRERGGSDAFHRRALVGFHQEFSQHALERGWLRLLTLRVGGEPAAGVYCFRYGGTFSFYQAGFDPGYAKQSVGLVTMGLAIKTAIEEGAEEFDLLHGDESYKFHWACQTRELGRLALYPAHKLGALCRRTAELDRAARRAARRFLLRQPVNDVTHAP